VFFWQSSTHWWCVCEGKNNRIFFKKWRGVSSFALSRQVKFLWFSESLRWQCYSMLIIKQRICDYGLLTQNEHKDKFFLEPIMRVLVLLYSCCLWNYKIPSRTAMHYDTYSWYSCRIKTRICSFVPINPVFVNSPFCLL